MKNENLTLYDFSIIKLTLMHACVINFHEENQLVC